MARGKCLRCFRMFQSAEISPRSRGKNAPLPPPSSLFPRSRPPSYPRRVLVRSVPVATPEDFPGIIQEMRFVLFSKVSAFLAAATLISGERFSLERGLIYNLL